MVVVAWPSAFEQRGAKQSHRSRFLERQRSGCVVHGHLTTLAADSGSLVVVSQVGELSGAWSDSSLRPGAAAAEAQVLDLQKRGRTVNAALCPPTNDRSPWQLQKTV